MQAALLIAKRWPWNEAGRAALRVRVQSSLAAACRAAQRAMAETGPRPAPAPPRLPDCRLKNDRSVIASAPPPSPSFPPGCSLCPAGRITDSGGNHGSTGNGSGEGARGRKGKGEGGAGVEKVAASAHGGAARRCTAATPNGFLHHPRVRSLDWTGMATTIVRQRVTAKDFLNRASELRDGYPPFFLQQHLARLHHPTMGIAPCSTSRRMALDCGQERMRCIAWVGLAWRGVAWLCGISEWVGTEWHGVARSRSVVSRMQRHATVRGAR